MFAPKEPYAYFHPGEMLFHVIHGPKQLKSNQLNDDESDKPINAESNSSEDEEPIDPKIGGLESDQSSDAAPDDDDGDLSYDKKIESLILWSDTRAEKLGLRVVRRTERELRFPAMPEVIPDPKWEAMLKEKRVDYKSPRLAAQDPFDLIFVTVEDRKDSTAYVKDERLVTLILDLDDNRAGLVLGEGTTLRVGPNWLISPASETGGGGGPGSRPVPYRPTGNAVPYHMDLPKIIQDLCPKERKQRGANVKVAILDTAPCLPDRIAAYERWQKVNPALNPVPNHELIETLLRPNGPLHVYHASPDEVNRMRAIHLRDHNYIMTDHGLFVAGIIHEIAPAAEIHLFEVLNSNGVGDLQTIADGLQKVYDSFAGDLLVVNFSIVLNLPTSNHRITNLDPRLVQRIYPGWHEDPDPSKNHFVDIERYPPDRNVLEHYSDMIMKICNLIYSRNSRVIAAAGNDRVSQNMPKPAARYPAASESVVGVGALPIEEASRTAAAIMAGNVTESSFSNTADRPESYGITTLGGEPGAKGIIGVYIGNFPPVTFFQHILAWIISLLGGVYGRNPYDWARWAGTSFATPILTGVIAAVLSGQKGYSSVEETIVGLYYERALLEGRPNRPIREDRLLEIIQG